MKHIVQAALLWFLAAGALASIWAWVGISRQRRYEAGLTDRMQRAVRAEIDRQRSEDEWFQIVIATEDGWASTLADIDALGESR